MSLVRLQDRKANPAQSFTQQSGILLVEDSFAMAMLLRKRLEAQIACHVTRCATYAEAEALLAHEAPALAIVGYDLPDAPHGEALRLLVDKNIPTILFTTRIDPLVREQYEGTSLIDYFLKDTPDAINNIIQQVHKFLCDRSVPVLVVDDQRSSRSPLVEILKRQNYRTFEASSGTDALKILMDNEDIELVITDYQMPDMDGYRLTRKIREVRPADRVRIIGISASADPLLSASFLKAGASDFIYRPFIAEEVQCRINNNLETLEQIRRLRYLAERDPLTGLYNRRAFFEASHIKLEDLHGSGGEGSVAMLDIDHFKKVNDTYGHDAGDSVIREVASVLSEIALRKKILTARFGGEEFVMIFTGMSSEEVHEVCEEIRQSIAKIRVIHDETVVTVTASIGLARIQLDEGIDNNLNAADQMLYMAKGGGRNQVFSDRMFLVY